jgi:hypothetical protein
LVIVPGAGLARFWIETVFEKFELPAVASAESPLDIAPAWYVTAASEAFATSFVQGAQWC